MTSPTHAAQAEVDAVRAAVAALQSRLLEATATSRSAEACVVDAIAALEKGIILTHYEIARQAGVAKARADREAQDKINAERKAAEEIRQKHIRVLSREATRKRQLREAEAFAKNQTKGTP